MSNQSITDVVNTTVKFMDSSFEWPVETEFLLADYDQEVFKIIKTTVEHTITQKYLNGTKAVMEGFFKVCVYYQPPQQKILTLVTKKIPFQYEVDTQQVINSPYFMNIEGELEYVNTRAINSSRIDVRGVYSFKAKGYSKGESSVTTAVNSKSVCCDSAEIGHFYLSGSGSRQFSLEEEIMLPENLEKIINIKSYKGKNTINVYDDKVNVSGSIEVEVAYTRENQPNFQYINKTYNFNQTVDVEGIKQNNIAFANLNIYSFTVTKNPDTEKTNFILSAGIDVKVFSKSSVVTVLNAFSKEYEYEKEESNVVYDENLILVDKSISLSLEDNIGSGFTPVYHFADISSPKIYYSGDKGELKAKISFTSILKNGNEEYECFSKTGEVKIDTGEDILSSNEYLITPYIEDSNFTITNETVKANVTVGFSGWIIKRRKVRTVKSFEENKEKPIKNDYNALILYYGEKGEKIFDIARQYKTDVETIIEENQLSDKVLKDDRMLFISAFGM